MNELERLVLEKHELLRQRQQVTNWLVAAVAALGPGGLFIADEDLQEMEDRTVTVTPEAGGIMLRLKDVE